MVRKTAGIVAMERAVASAEQAVKSQGTLSNPLGRVRAKAAIPRVDASQRGRPSAAKTAGSASPRMQPADLSREEQSLVAET